MGTNLQALRFASTAPIASTDPTSSGPTESVAVPTDDFNTPSVEDITADLPPVPETLGYLKDLGLDFGWGPTAFVEYLLEHVHIYTATPWWASILLTALAVRLALLKPYIDASDTSTRVVTMTELAKPIKARLDAAKSCRDQVAVMQAAQEMKALYQQAGIKLWKTTVPLLQVPIGYGTFRLLRRMAELPVPGLEDGGFLWLKDLTISDPYYLLPALTGWAIHLTFKAGGEMNSMNNMSPGMAKFMLYGAPVMGGGFMLMYPACMQLTFGFTAVMALIQAYLFRQPWVRERLGICPLPKRNPETGSSRIITSRLNMYQPPSQTPPALELKSGVTGKAKEKFSEAKGAASEFMKSMKNLQGSTAKDAKKPGPANSELSKAQMLQERRLNHIAQAKFEAERRKSEAAAESRNRAQRESR